MDFAMFDDGEDDGMFFDDEDEDEEEPPSPNGSSVAGPLSGPLAQRIPVPKGFAAVISNLLGAASVSEFSFGGRASQLPSAPGLEVEGMGTVPLPLRSPFAEQLVQVCEKAPYGKDFDTFHDDSVRKSWQLSPDKVKILNWDWEANLGKLVEQIADRLGCRGIPLACPLYKLLVYGPGGHFVRHKDTEKADGMFATLVVQLPSLHEGGDLIVYNYKKDKTTGEGHEHEHKHDFGKLDGSAPYSVQYAVHYADAEHALLEVKSGYRLVLVYSLCLPDNMRDLDITQMTAEGDDDDMTKQTLARAIKGFIVNKETVQDDAEEDDEMNENGRDTMVSGDPLPGSFTLMLTHEYTESSINRLGCGALKGDDRTRFLKLQAANESLPIDNRLQFYVVKLSYDIDYYDTSGGFNGRFDWEENQRSESVVAWHGSKGNKLSYQRDTEASNTRGKTVRFPLQLLNPDNCSIEELWGEEGTNKYEGYMGNEGATKSTKYCRYGLAAWPLAQDAINSLAFIGETHAVSILRGQRPLNSSQVDDILRLVEKVSTYIPSYGLLSERKHKLSAEFARSLIDLLQDASDAQLVTFFLENAFLRAQQKQDVIEPLTALILQFDWSEIGPAFISFFDKFKPWGEQDRYNDEAKSIRCIDAIQMCVRIAEEMLDQSLDNQTGAEALARVAVDRIKTIVPAELPECRFTIMWRVLGKLNDKTLLTEMLTHFRGIGAAHLRTVVDSMAEASEEVRAAGQQLSIGRLEWVNQKIAAAAKSSLLSWKIPNAQFPGNPQVLDFLRGPEQRIIVRNMSGIPEARKFVTRYNYLASDGAFTMEAGGRGRDAHVVITKTRQSETDNKSEIRAMHQEGRKIARIFGGEVIALPSRFGGPGSAAQPATNSRKRRTRE